jgi:hypothetical protein
MAFTMKTYRAFHKSLPIFFTNLKSLNAEKLYSWEVKPAEYETSSPSDAIAYIACTMIYDSVEHGQKHITRFCYADENGFRIENVHTSSEFAECIDAWLEEARRTMWNASMY